MPPCRVIIRLSNIPSGSVAIALRRSWAKSASDSSIWRTMTQATNAIADQPHGVYFGTGQPEWVPGIVGGAVRLPGQRGRFECGEPFNPERTDPFSYGCWYLQNDAYPGSNGNLNGILIKQKDARGIELGTTTNGVFTSLRNTHSKVNGIFVFGEGEVSFGEWHHLMVTYDGSSTVAGVTFYTDGQVRKNGWSTDRLSKTTQTPGTPFRIQSRVPIVIDDVRIYDRVLGQAEVQQLFQSGLQSLAGVAVEKRTPAQQSLLTTAFRARRTAVAFTRAIGRCPEGLA